jgi:hypothetical protein
MQTQTNLFLTFVFLLYSLSSSGRINKSIIIAGQALANTGTFKLLIAISIQDWLRFSIQSSAS